MRVLLGASEDERMAKANISSVGALAHSIYGKHRCVRKDDSFDTRYGCKKERCSNKFTDAARRRRIAHLCATVDGKAMNSTGSVLGEVKRGKETL